MRSTVTLVLLSLVACGEDPESGDTGADASADAAVVCEVPDTVCPEEQPVGGALCEGELNCSYPQGRSFSDDWEYECVAGQWVAGEAPCSTTSPNGECAVPPLAERCRDPFEGELMGASVQVGPASAGEFRPFMSGELVDPVLGGQGLAMLELQLFLDGADALRCATVSTVIGYAGVRSDPAVSNTSIQCGNTRRIFVVLPSTLPCTGEVGITLEVDVAGVGSTTVELRLNTELTCVG